MPLIERGQIYDCDFGPRNDHRQEGKRPALIVQTDLLNQIEGYSLTLIVPLTTKGRPSPTYVRIEPTGENGLREISYAKCEQVYTMTMESLGPLRGKLSKADLHPVNEALRLVFDLR